MTAFPAIAPSSRTWTPGEYPHETWIPYSGNQTRVRISNAMLSSQLRMQFIAITEEEMLSLLAHYQERSGSFYSFSLPPEVWTGLATPGDMELSGYTWRYLDPPVVTDVGCGRHTVEVALEASL